MLKVVFHPRANKELIKIPKNTRLKILDKISEFQKLNHPLQHQGVIKLSGRKTEDFRLRTGDYRIKFALNGDIIFITHIQHRQIGY